MSVNARFYVSQITRRSYNPDHVEVELQAAGRGEENKSWAAATPAGSIKMTINNPPAAAFFGERLGKDIHVTFAAHEDDTLRVSPHQQ